jgi:hypothetical protein
VSSPPRDTPELVRYEAILAHAELELELAGRGDIDGLEALGESWLELMEPLPQSVPPAARALLERARLISERARIELIRMREAVLLDSAASLHAKRAADGYGRELRPEPQLSRSA